MSERKRQKITKTTTIAKFEQLPNELILICFAYFDFYHFYQLFNGLNQRFQKLIQNHPNICIQLDRIPDEKFLTFCIQLNEFLMTTENYPTAIWSDNKHKLQLLFHDDLFQTKFSKLKSITTAKIDVSTLFDIIFDERTQLYDTLERLSLVERISGTCQNIDRKYLSLYHLCAV